MTDPLALVLSQLAPVLKSLGIRYAIVGSLASSAHGVYRATADGDLLAQIRPQQARQLAAALGKDWYAEPDAMEAAIREGRAFNLIHMTTATKVDIFPARTDFHAGQIERASVITVFPQDDALQLPVASAEDVVLVKLQRYRAGGEVSEKQWSDIAGILATQTGLDFAYMEAWAKPPRRW
jgi:hypothetical protein